MSLNLPKVFSPMPLTFIKSSIFLNGPFCLRKSRIRCAISRDFLSGGLRRLSGLLSQRRNDQEGGDDAERHAFRQKALHDEPPFALGKSTRRANRPKNGSSLFCVRYPEGVVVRRRRFETIRSRPVNGD
jgi:hypothetical protein